MLMFCILILDFASAAPEQSNDEGCMFKLQWDSYVSDFYGRFISPEKCTPGLAFKAHRHPGLRKRNRISLVLDPVNLKVIPAVFDKASSCCLNTINCGTNDRGICSNVEKKCSGGHYMSV